jgi:hypothetical protein
MLPRSNRPVKNASFRSTDNAAKPAAYAAIEALIRTLGRVRAPTDLTAGVR